MTEVQHDRRHPPFAPGNRAALKAGEWSPAVIDPLTQVLVDLFVSYAAADGSPVGYLQDPTFRVSLWRWAQTEQRAQLKLQQLAEHEAGGCRGCERCLGWDVQADRWVRSAAKQASELGLTPASRAKLLKDGTEAARTGFNLEQIKKAGEATQQQAPS